MTERKKTVRLTTSQKFQIKELLENLLERLPDDPDGTRRCRYRTLQWDDGENAHLQIHTDVAAAYLAKSSFGYEVPTSALAGVRKEFFGEKRLPPRPAADTTETVTAMAALISLNHRMETAERYLNHTLDYLTRNNPLQDFVDPRKT